MNVLRQKCPIKKYNKSGQNGEMFMKNLEQFIVFFLFDIFSTRMSIGIGGI